MMHCITIDISFLGNDRRIGQLVRQARGYPKPSGDPPDSEIHKVRWTHFDGCFEFNQLVALPEAFSQVPYKPQGQLMEKETWGVIEGSFADVPPSYEEGHAMYQFDCWDVPYLFFEKVSRSWPDLWIVITYSDPDEPARGRMVFYQGTYLEQTRDEDGCPSPGDETPCDEPGFEWLDVRTAWVDYYLRHHEEYVEYVLSTYILKEN